jgi:DNA-binding NtrC family response regulator
VCDIMMPLPDKAAAAAPLARVSDAPRPGRAQEAAPEAACLLLVEDEPLIGLDMHDMLEDAGYHVLGPAATVEEARALIETGDYDLVLLDANMNGEPVDDLAAAITRRAKPFVFVTGYGREALPAAFRQAPLLTKPLLPQAAIRMIEKMLEVPENAAVLPRAVAEA